MGTKRSLKTAQASKETRRNNSLETQKESESKFFEREPRGNCLAKKQMSEEKVKIQRAYGGCLGTRRRRRTRPAAKSHGELQANLDPWISEWGNLVEANLYYPYLNI